MTTEKEDILQSIKENKVEKVRQCLESITDAHQRQRLLDHSFFPMSFGFFCNTELDITNMLKMFMQQGLNINNDSFYLSMHHNFRVSALTYTASKGHNQLLSLLIDIGADVSCRAVNGITALAAAVEANNLEAVQILLAKKAASDERSALLSQRAHLDWTPISLAIANNHDDIIDALLNAYLESGTPIPCIALEEAINLRKEGLIERLIDIVPGNVYNDDSHFGRKGGPIVCAASVGNLKAIQLLLAKGANIHYTGDSGYKRISALEAAAKNGHTNVVVELLKMDNFSKNIIEDSFCAAAEYGHVDVVVELLKSTKVEESKLVDSILMAATNGHINVIHTLLVHGINIQVCDEQGFTALMLAAGHGHVELFNYLIRQGADIAACSENQFKAVHYAAFNGHTQIVRMLIEEGGDVDCADDKGQTPLMLAVERQCAKTVALLIEAGADYAATNVSGQTVLDMALAVAYRTPELVEIIRILRDAMGIENPDAAAGQAF